jgi:HAD superfamily hydrolase (TIGR01549 family)
MRKDLRSFALTYGIKTEYKTILGEIEEHSSFLPPEKAKAFKEGSYRIIDNHEIEAAKHPIIFEDALEVLKKIKSKKIKIGVVSRNSLQCVQTALEEALLVDHVDVVVGRESTERTKPDAAPILYALDRLKRPPSTAVFLGDHISDLMASRASKVKFILFGERSVPDAEGELKVKTLAELTPLLEKLNHKN